MSAYLHPGRYNNIKSKSGQIKSRTRWVDCKCSRSRRTACLQFTVTRILTFVQIGTLFGSRIRWASLIVSYVLCLYTMAPGCKCLVECTCTIETPFSTMLALILTISGLGSLGKPVIRFGQY